MNPIRSIAAATLLAAAVGAQLQIDHVRNVSPYLNSTIILAADQSAPSGTAFYMIQAPVSDFRPIPPDSLLLQAPESSQTLTAVFVAPNGIKIIILTPCARYTSIESCIRAHAKAIELAEQTFGLDRKASRDNPVTIIMKPSK